MEDKKKREKKSKKNRHRSRSRSRSRSPEKERRKHAEKKKEKIKEKEKVKESSTAWLYPLLRVRCVDSDFKSGKHYKKKVISYFFAPNVLVGRDRKIFNIPYTNYDFFLRWSLLMSYRRLTAFAAPKTEYFWTASAYRC